MTLTLKFTELLSQLDLIYEEAGTEEDTEEDSPNPLLMRVRFIFTDDKPNENNQGIEYEDFPAVMRSAINAPIKMRYLGDVGVGGHPMSVTIGHITDMEEDVTSDGTHRLIANGIVYAGEYPKEAAFLRESFKNGEAPGISWELAYKEEKKQGPIEWLKGIITRAATFVKHPAYGTRTALLALASDQNLSDEELDKEIIAFAQNISPKNEDKGGSNTVEEELKKLQAELEAKITEIETLTSAKSELEAKVISQEEVIATYQRNQLVAERTAKVSQAGLILETDPERLAKKQEFWASLKEEDFEEYLADLSAAAKVTTAQSRTAQASATDGIPRVEGVADIPLTLDDIKDKFRKMNRK